MSDNWVVQNLENALETWNEKLAEIWQLITTSPQNFKGGGIWSVIVNINGALQAIGLALLVLFFVIGVVRTCGSFTEVKSRTRTQTVHSICHCQRRHHLWNGVNACAFQYRAGNHFFDNDGGRLRKSAANHPAGRDDNHNRGLRFLLRAYRFGQ